MQQGQDAPGARPAPAADLAEVLGSGELHLPAERKSPQTVKAYRDGVRGYLAWCASAARPAVFDRRQLREFVDALLSDGARPATAVSQRSRRPAVLRLAHRGG